MYLNHFNIARRLEKASKGGTITSKRQVPHKNLEVRRERTSSLLLIFLTNFTLSNNILTCINPKIRRNM